MSDTPANPKRPFGRTRSKSEAETVALATALAEQLEPGAVVGLVGDLGAGKTCFVRGVARALGVPEAIPVRSPTYNVVNSYPGRVPIHHFDLYRLADEDELEAVGYRDYVEGEGITLLEWADRIDEVLSPGAIVVTIDDGDFPDERIITIIRVPRPAPTAR